MDHQIRVLTDPEEIGRSVGVFLTAMVGLTPVDPARIAEFDEPGRTVGIDLPTADPAGRSRLVATATSFTSRIVVPGGRRVPQAAITDVGVLPTHTRCGLAGALIRHQLEQCLERGDPLASLRASEATIYGRWGFGVASDAAKVEIEVARAGLRPGVPTGGEIRLVDLGDPADQDLLERIYRGADWVGAIDRPEGWWRSRAYIRGLGNLPHYAVVHGSPGHEDGFAIYAPEATAGWLDARDRVGVVEDFVATTPDARIGLLRYLLSVDLLTRIVLGAVPIDHGIETLLVDRRALSVRSVHDETWLRLVDVHNALAARTFTGPGEVVLEVTDDLLGHNSGCYLVSADAVTRTRRQPDLSLDVAELACTYLGGTAFWQLARAGRIGVHDPDRVALADRLFAVDRAPFAGTDF